jgi:hypothetical protein
MRAIDAAYATTESGGPALPIAQQMGSPANRQRHTQKLSRSPTLRQAQRCYQRGTGDKLG